MIGEPVQEVMDRAIEGSGAVAHQEDGTIRAIGKGLVDEPRRCKTKVGTQVLGLDTNILRHEEPLMIDRCLSDQLQGARTSRAQERGSAGAFDQ